MLHMIVYFEIFLKLCKTLHILIRLNEIQHKGRKC